VEALGFQPGETMVPLRMALAAATRVKARFHIGPFGTAEAVPFHRQNFKLIHHRFIYWLATIYRITILLG
jgi:hypothetical protein